MATEANGAEPDPELLRALVERVWGKETVVHLKFDRFEAALGELRVELDGDLRIKVVLGERPRPAEREATA
ncbi:MAG: hypothetical protein QXO51_01050 [Halobacteria archaeon]